MERIGGQLGLPFATSTATTLQTQSQIDLSVLSSCEFAAGLNILQGGGWSQASWIQ